MSAVISGEPIADAAQARVIFHPHACGSLAVLGPPGCGKSFALMARARQLVRHGAGTILVTAPADAGVLCLARALGDVGAGIACASFADVAFTVLREQCGRAVEPIDDIAASLHFERAGADLFALEWTEFVSSDIDPEITGLRTPERFAAAAFRLIRKLRSSLISIDDFRSAGLRGATAFYANAPNFADADLLAGTPPKYRDSLRPGAAELERQRRREVDLVLILTRLYTSYVDALVAAGCLTPTDAVYEAALALRGRAPDRRLLRPTYDAILIDDAQDLSAAQLALLEGIAADGLTNVTFAGDPLQSTRSFMGGGRGTDALKGAAAVVELDGRYRCAPAIERFAQTLFARPARAASASDAVALYRGGDMRDEARYVADNIARRITSGVPAQELAVITRNLRCAGPYIDALLARGVSVDVGGAASLFEFRSVGDALGALWSAVDPYRHDYLLRTLASPWLGLCDASLAILCGDAPDPQPLLFDLAADPTQPARAGRWDRRRDVRLGRNVTRGDVDACLPADARERLTAFREARARWEGWARTLEPAELAALVLDETVGAQLDDDARGRFEHHLIDRLIDALAAAAQRDPLASLHDLLQRFEHVADAQDDLLGMTVRDEDAVRVLDVESAKGHSFEAVFVVDVRAGAWPRYYAPDAFLFLPSLGMLPKENVGEAQAARTAKFTYALHRYKLREKYAAEDRRALYTALSRARTFLSVSACGRPSRGLSTPEFFEELRAASPEA